VENIELHSKVKIDGTSFIGEVVGIYQERLDDPFNFYVLYRNKDGEKQNEYLRDDEITLI